MNMAGNVHESVARLTSMDTTTDERKARRGDEWTRLSLSYVDGAEENEVWVTVSDAMMCAVELLWDAHGRIRERHAAPGWRGIQVPFELLCALVCMTMSTTKHMVQEGTQRAAYNVIISLCIEHGTVPQTLMATLPYISPFVPRRASGDPVATRQDPAGSPGDESIVRLLSVVYIIHHFPHAVDISLCTWLYVALCMQSGKGISNRLMWDEYYKDVVNAFIGFKSIKELKQAYKHVTDNINSIVRASRADRSGLSVLVREYTIVHDVRTLVRILSSKHENAYIDMINLVPASVPLVALRFARGGGIGYLDVKTTWNTFQRLLNHHMLQSIDDEHHVIMELFDETIWMLPEEHLDVFMRVSPLMQADTSMYPGRASALRLWSDKRYHYLIVAWLARQEGIGDITCGEMAGERRTEEWTERVIKSMMAAGSADGVRAAIAQACGFGCPVRPVARSRFDDADRARASLAADALEISHSERHKHVVAFIRSADEEGGDRERVAVIVRGMDRPPPILAARCKREPNVIATSSHVAAALDHHKLLTTMSVM